jgi:hypothetical protein
MRRLATAAGAALFLSVVPASAKSWSCQGFMDAYNAAAGEHRVEFARSLSVGGGGSGFAYYDGQGRGDVDVSVACKGEVFMRLEVRAAADSNARQGGRFERLQAAGLKVALGQDGGKAAATLHSLQAEAKDYLRASVERGDVVEAGKVERHFGSVDLAMMATASDLTFILVTQ